MKYVVGDLLLIKDIRPRLHLRLNNTYGIITEAINHNDAWEGESKECDNVYIWFSQIDGKEYLFYEDEAECDVVK